MGAAKTIKKILIDKDKTITALAEEMGKPRQTVANTFSADNLRVATLMEYANALGCEIILKDTETGREYPIYE